MRKLNIMEDFCIFSLFFFLFFPNFAVYDGELTPSQQKKRAFFLFCSRLFVTLQTEKTK